MKTQDSTSQVTGSSRTAASVISETSTSSIFIPGGYDYGTRSVPFETSLVDPVTGGELSTSSLVSQSTPTSASYLDVTISETGLASTMTEIPNTSKPIPTTFSTVSKSSSMISVTSLGSYGSEYSYEQTKGNHVANRHHNKHNGKEKWAEGQRAKWWVW
jgi:hypothetical protein